MKINVIKQPGGVLVPATDMESDKLNRFETGNTYEIDIRHPRNPAFHGKVFAFFNFCFEHWKSTNEYMCESGQFDVFRNHMTVLAGYYDSFHSIDGSTRVEAKSLSYGAMQQDEFEKVYQALIQVAMQKIFSGSDEQIYRKLISFF